MPLPEDYDLTRHLNTSFGMFVGAPQRVELNCDNSVMDYIVDRFGDEVETAPLDESTFQASVDVAVSKPFFGWVFGFDGKIKIAGPEDVKNEYEAMLRKAYENN